MTPKIDNLTLPSDHRSRYATAFSLRPKALAVLLLNNRIVHRRDTAENLPLNAGPRRLSKGNTTLGDDIHRILGQVRAVHFNGMRVLPSTISFIPPVPPQPLRKTYIVAKEDTAIVRAANASAPTPPLRSATFAVQFRQVADSLTALANPVRHWIALGLASELLPSPLAQYFHVWMDL